jgi:hypothetical protein
MDAMNAARVGAPLRGPFLTTILTLLTASCTDPDISPAFLKVQLEDGRMIRDLLATERQTQLALLLYPAEACLACSSPLSHWLEAKRNGRIDLVLLVAGQPSEADRRILRIHRVPVSGYLPDASIQTDQLPAEYIVEGGRLRDKAEGWEAIWRLRLWEQVLR